MSILTDDEIDKLPLSAATVSDGRADARAVEAAVLAKLREQGRLSAGPEDMAVYDAIAKNYAAPVPAVPEGWKLVPLKLTPEMRIAQRGPGPRVLPAYVGAVEKADALEDARYERLLAAAPEAPKEKP